MCKKLRFFFFYILMTVLCSCSYQQARPELVKSSIDQAAVNYGFKRQNIPTTSFTLFSLLRPAKDNNNKTLHVYIEGDGQAWLTRYRPSSDPTPTNTTTLDIAKSDPSTGSILYLARPCQYLRKSQVQQCDKKYWTSHRFSNEVITATDEAIDVIKKQVGANKVVLVGFSGGGAVATLVAARRKHKDDISFLGSIAGNLDLKTWVNWHKITPLSGSLDPIDVAPMLRNIPQRHMTSFDDEIIPPQTNNSFCKRLLKPESCITVQGIGHNGRWNTRWSYKY